ncbi:hypothetical protein Ahy_A03g016965 [Arachis hypogaea]|uniref:Uncharacterized protein n=1 Tax=Arachis hypogaea TaxID=3818 RepID=A0A445E520_ARAHY|nr:hypothetical protein Ahy_A03g016965 [Arachis hypogaea]
MQHVHICFYKNFQMFKLWPSPFFHNSKYRIKLGIIDDFDCACFVTGGTTNVNATRPHMLLQKLSNVQVVPSPFFHNSKYRIKLGIIDDSDCACFVKGDLSDTPTLLLNLIDKTFLFIVEAQISDNPHFSPSYTVKKMTDNVDLINKFKETHPIQIDIDYTGGLLLISKTFSIIEGEKVEGAKKEVFNLTWCFIQNLLFEFSNEVAASDESELLENAITPTKRLSSESEESKVEGDTSTCKKIKIEKET